MSNSKQEIEEVISELASLECNFNLRLNKKKSDSSLEKLWKR